ncbi:MAG: pilin [Candidatus Daviesbacteria bacterium]|nr:pilin [Candidatus Daviesbacteria bacterium]
MSKVIIFTLLLFGLIFIYPQIYGLVQAQAFTISPQTPTTLNDSVNIEISKLIKDKEYVIGIKREGQKNGVDLIDRKADSEGKIAFRLCPSGLGGYNSEDNCKGTTFKEGIYLVNVSEYKSTEGKKLVAKFSFPVSIKTAGVIEFLNTSFTTIDDIIIKVSNISKGSYKILVDGNDPTQGKSCVDTDNDVLEVNIGKYYEGSHNLAIYRNEKSIKHPLCGKGALLTYGSFKIDNSGKGGSGPVVKPGTETLELPNGKLCKSENDSTFDEDTDMVCSSSGGIPCGTDVNNPGIATAIGCIHTNPVALVKDFLKFALGISGGLAFLLMLLGAFQMLTSAGNPETLAAGKGRLTSAIIGLLFVIFSVLLLKIIGVDILGLEKQFGYP